MFRWIALLPLAALFACSSAPPHAGPVRLVDVFSQADVIGSAARGTQIPRTEWRFDSGASGWKAHSRTLTAKTSGWHVLLLAVGREALPHS